MNSRMPPPSPENKTTQRSDSKQDAQRDLLKWIPLKRDTLPLERDCKEIASFRPTTVRLRLEWGQPLCANFLPHVLTLSRRL